MANALSPGERNLAESNALPTTPNRNTRVQMSQANFPHSMSALQAAQAIRAGNLTSQALVRDCLDRIAARDSKVHAWVNIDANAALGAARILDAQPVRTMLHGVPIGVKDVIDAAGLPTECLSPIYRGNYPNQDAAVVARARQAGLVILGKTVTTELATRGAIGATRNPHDLRYSPGGSSSGSAAAVADRMVPLALSTQTAGSVIRPASYCGVVGFKPSFGVLDTTGMKPIAPTLDTLGLHARDVDDAAALYLILTGSPSALPGATPPGSLRVGVTGSPAAGQASLDVLAKAANRLRDAGAKVDPVDLPPPCQEELDRAHDAISDYEAWQSLADERTQHWALLSSGIQEKLLKGQALGHAAYRSAVRHLHTARAAAASVFDRFDCLLTPSAPGPAPRFELRDTGSAACNKRWTALGVPAINLPASSINGLPIGIQLVGRPGGDIALLQAARGIATVLAPC